MPHCLDRFNRKTVGGYPASPVIRDADGYNDPCGMRLDPDSVKPEAGACLAILLLFATTEYSVKPMLELEELLLPEMPAQERHGEHDREG